MAANVIHVPEISFKSCGLSWDTKTKIRFQICSSRPLKVFGFAISRPDQRKVESKILNIVNVYLRHFQGWILAYGAGTPLSRVRSSFLNVDAIVSSAAKSLKTDLFGGSREYPCRSPARNWVERGTLLAVERTVWVSEVLLSYRMVSYLAQPRAE